MSSTQALIPTLHAGNGDAIGRANTQLPPSSDKNDAKPLTDELVAEILKGRGLHGWLRLARVARVLGPFTPYLFLDTYYVPADFNPPLAETPHPETAPSGLMPRAKPRPRYFL